MKFIGFDGEIEILNDAVKIKKGKKDVGRIIKLSDIISVSLIKPQFLVPSGCIHIQVIGAKTYPSVCNAVHYSTDSNAISFRKAKCEEAEMFKSELEKILSCNRNALQNTSMNADEMSAKLLKMFNDMSFEEKMEILNIMMEKKKENKT